jgi:hypothetical protein
MMQTLPRRLGAAILVLGLASIYPVLSRAPAAGLVAPSFPQRPVIPPMRPPLQFGPNNPNITIGGMGGTNNGNNNNNGGFGNTGGFGNNGGGFQTGGGFGNTGGGFQIGGGGQQGGFAIGGAGGGLSGNGFGVPTVTPGGFGGASSIFQMPQIQPQLSIIGTITGFQGAGGSLQGFGGFQAGGFQGGGGQIQGGFGGGGFQIGGGGFQIGGGFGGQAGGFGGAFGGNAFGFGKQGFNGQYGL